MPIGDPQQSLAGFYPLFKSLALPCGGHTVNVTPVAEARFSGVGLAVVADRRLSERIVIRTRGNSRPIGQGALVVNDLQCDTAAKHLVVDPRDAHGKHDALEIFAVVEHIGRKARHAA